MKHLIILFFCFIISSPSIFAEGGGGGGGATISPNASHVVDIELDSNINITEIIKDFSGTVINKKIINVDQPELINTIKMVNGDYLSYPERGELIQTNNVDSILLNDGRSIHLVKPSLVTLPNEIIFDRNLKTNLLNSFNN